MRPNSLTATVFSMFLLVTSASAQAPPSGVPRPVRVVLASGRLASVVESPLYFNLVRVSVPAGQSTTYAGPNGMLWVMSGTLDVAFDAERRSLREGAGTFVPLDRRVTLTAGPGTTAVALHYVLVPPAQLQHTWYTPPAMAVELHRSREPLPNLKPGPHELTLVRVTVDKGVPSPPLHHRSGAALYYVHSGTWTIHMVGVDETRTRGATQLEPNGFLHTWQIMSDAPGVLIQANVSAEGTPEIIWMPR